MLTGLVLAAASSYSIYLTFQELPGQIQNWCINHSFITNMLVSWGTWLTISAVTESLGGVIASAFVGLFMDLYLKRLRSQRAG